MTTTKWALLAAAMAPKEIQSEVLTAGITSGLDISTRNRAIFDSVQIQSTHQRHLQKVETAERGIGVEVLDAVFSFTNGADIDSPEFKEEYGSIARRGLDEHLRRVPVVMEEGSAQVTNNDLIELIDGIKILVRNGKVELNAQDSRRYPILKSHLAKNGIFKEKITELIKEVAKTKSAPG